MGRTTEEVYVMSDADASDAGPTEETLTWPELAIGLYDRLTGRGAEVTYEFEDLEVDVPSRAGEDAAHAHWQLNGTLRVKTRDARER